MPELTKRANSLGVSGVQTDGPIFLIKRFENYTKELYYLRQKHHAVFCPAKSRRHFDPAKHRRYSAMVTQTVDSPRRFRHSILEIDKNKDNSLNGHTDNYIVLYYFRDTHAEFEIDRII